MEDELSTIKYIVEFLFRSQSSKIDFRQKMNWNRSTTLLGITPNHTTLDNEFYDKLSDKPDFVLSWKWMKMEDEL